MNSKLDEIGTALGNARVELSNLIIEFKTTLKPSDSYRTYTMGAYESALCAIAHKSIEVHDLDEKWHDAEYKEFMSDDQDQSIFNDDHDIHYDEAIDPNDMER